MALPGDLSTFSLTLGAYTDAAGTVMLVGATAKLFPVDPATGKRLHLVHVATGAEIIPADIVITIGAGGTATVGPLPHTDNAGLSTIGFAYKVEWQVASGRRRSAPDDKMFAVPTASGATVDYDLLDVADAVPGVLVPIGTGPQGPAGPTGPQGPAGSGSPTGGAGGALSGTYPNPGLNTSAVDTSVAASVNDTDSETATALVAKYRRRQFLGGLSPLLYMNQYGSQRVICGTDGAKLWSFNSGGLYQVDSLTSTAWQSKTLPTNVVTTNGAKVIIPSAGWPGAGVMYLLAYNTSTARFQVYSAPPVTGSTQPTWTGPLLSLAANATLIPNAFRATSVGIFVGEYTGTPDIAAGPSVYRSTNGTSFTTVLGPLAGTRHVHGVYEDSFDLGTIYVPVGDQAITNWCYRSTDGGATFNPVTTMNDAVGSTWQAVAMGFTADWVVFIGDQVQGLGPFLLDRDDDSVRWATTATKFSRLAVPGGVGGRIITDLAITSSSTTATSATAAFSSFDVGRMLQGPNNVQDGTYISAVTNSTTITLSRAATGTQTALTAVIGGDRFFETAYEGVVDETTGAIYVCPNDTSNRGNTAAIFMLPEPGAEWSLLHVIPLAIGATAIGSHEMFLTGGKLFVDRYGPITVPTLTAA